MTFHGGRKTMGRVGKPPPLRTPSRLCTRLHRLAHGGEARPRGPAKGAHRDVGEGAGEYLAIGEDAAGLGELLDLQEPRGPHQPAQSLQAPVDLLVGDPVEDHRADDLRLAVGQREFEGQDGANLQRALRLGIERVPVRPTLDIGEHRPDRLGGSPDADAVLDLDPPHQALSLSRQVAPVGLSITSTLRAVNSARMASALAQSLAARAATRRAIRASMRAVRAASAPPWNQASGSACRKPIRAPLASSSPLALARSAGAPASSRRARANSSALARGVLRSSRSASMNASEGASPSAGTSAARRSAP